MPQDRTLIHAEIDLSVERVRSHPTTSELSPLYAVDTPRFVLPMSWLRSARDSKALDLVDYPRDLAKGNHDRLNARATCGNSGTLYAELTDLSH